MSDKNNLIKNLPEKIKSLKFWASMLCFIVLQNFLFNNSIKVLEFFISPILATIIASAVWIVITVFYTDTVVWFINLLVSRTENLIHIPTDAKLLAISKILYSAKIQRELFEPIVADWQEEYFEALLKKEIRKARWINVRYTYAFLAAMWQKSPIGDLIEFISKLAK